MRKTTGISLLLLIFLSLCLMIFSLLSLSGATADQRLCQQSADRTTEYYAAVTQANKVLSMIDRQLAQVLQDAETAEDPQSAFLAGISDVTNQIPGVSWIVADMEETLTGASSSDSETIAYSVPISEDQVLYVKLSIRYPEENSDTMYKITAWQVINTDDWTPDTTQTLYQIAEAE